jgi:hypothetical protein
VINKTLQNKLLDKLKEVKSEARDDWAHYKPIFHLGSI